MKYLTVPLYLVAALGMALPAVAEDPELCLDCHEPAEDWQGLSPEEILADAKDKDKKNKRHEDNWELPDEVLEAMIAELLKKQ